MYALSIKWYIIRSCQRFFRYVVYDLLYLGNADGLGKTRRDEAFLSANYLGIRHSNVFVMDHELLRDGFLSNWPVNIISEIVIQCSMEFKPDLVNYPH